jgi:hypothetical protein
MGDSRTILRLSVFTMVLLTVLTAAPQAFANHSYFDSSGRAVHWMRGPTPDAEVSGQNHRSSDSHHAFMA